jgi:DNA polymerase-3 subunit gamma/tau
MSYLVLARKWRPLTFDDLAGQEPITHILKNALAQGKIAHAYIFSGPRGVGKTTSARILAKALNCKEGPTPAPCGICGSCVAITEGSAVDVIEIDGASNNSVDDIRDLRERVKYAPSGGRYKVYIIDEVHMLSGSAFNALLKTLEEPPSHVIFILATTEMKKIPATVLSRCQHMPFRRISANVIKARLRHIADAEKITISPHALGLVAKAADGSMRDSLTILDQVSSFSDKISEEQVQNLLGMTDFSMLAKTADALITGKRVELIEIINCLSEQGADFRAFTKELAQFFRDLLIASVVKQPEEILDLNDEELSAIKKLVSASAEDQLTLMLSEVMKAEADVRNSSLPRMALEMALIRTSFLSSLKPVKEVIENLNRLSREIPARPVPAAQQQKTPPAPPAAAAPKPEEDISEVEEEDNDTSAGPEPESEAEQEPVAEPDESIALPPEQPAETDINAIWHKVLNAIDAPLASKLEHASVELIGDQLHLVLNGGHAVFQNTISGSLGDIEKVLSGLAGRKIRITLSAHHKKTTKKKDLKQKALAEPVIMEALELFEGRIVDVLPIDNEINTRNGGDDV